MVFAVKQGDIKAKKAYAKLHISLLNMLTGWYPDPSFKKGSFV